MTKILIPIDFQKQSLLALDQSYNLARLLQAGIVLLYVHEQSGLFAGIFSKEQNDEMLARIEERLAGQIGRAHV